MALLPNEIFMAAMEPERLEECVPLCALFAPAGASEPARCSGSAVCDVGALLRRKRNQWIRTDSATRGKKTSKKKKK